MADRNDGAPLTLERPYESHLSHAIWELERSVRRGGASEAMRRTLVETHFQQIRYMEDLAEVARPQRTMLQLQPRPGDTLLLLPAEGTAADELYGLAEHFYRRGWAVMATNLSYRVLGKPAYSPTYWQTVADEAATRFDILAHYSTRIVVLGVGMSGLVALHLATMRRVSEVVAVFPTFDGEPGFFARLRTTLRKLVLRREEPLPRTWPEQQRLAAQSARATAATVAVPLYVVIEDRDDRSERGRAARAAQKLAQRAATKVRVLRPNEASTVRDLSPSILDDIMQFLRRH
jgi:pimeloyl-ACP methyl ester carboxylesterase